MRDGAYCHSGKQKNSNHAIKLTQTNTMNTINWNQYRLVIEDVAPEDGGGFRAFYPTLGYAPLGCGETVEEALASLEDGKGAVLDFLERFGETLSAPTDDDRRARMTACEATNNYAYAA